MISGIKHNESIQIGTPSSLGIKREEYLPAVRHLYDSNAHGLLHQATDSEFREGLLRTIPFLKFFDEMVLYQAETLQLAKHKTDGIVGFFGSPVELSRKIAKFILSKGAKSNGLSLDPELKAALSDPNTKTILNTALCVDANHRKQGIAKAMKLASEQCLREKYPKQKIILITGHEKNNNASSKTQDGLDYKTVFEYRYPWPLSLNFTIRAKVLDINNQEISMPRINSSPRSEPSPRSSVPVSLCL